MVDYGTVPWFDGAARLPREDAFDVGAEDIAAGPIKIAVPVFSRIANFDDLDPLRAEPEVSVVMVRSGEALPGDADLILLPGSKATLADLAFVRDQGWDIDIAAHVRRGGAVLQSAAVIRCWAGPWLTGRIEGPAAAAAGLGLLDVETVLTSNKKLGEVSGRETHTGAAVAGYEMHVGDTDGPGAAVPMLDLSGQADGAVSPDGQVMGCYVHGLFSSDAFRTAFLQRLRPRRAWRELRG